MKNGREMLKITISQKDALPFLEHSNSRRTQ